MSFLWSRETAALFELMVEADRARRDRASRDDRDAGRDGEDEDPEAGT